VPREWADLFITDGPQGAIGAPESGEGSERRRGLLRRLRENLSKTRQALGSEIQATLFAKLDEHTWERLEEALIMADVGASTTASVVETLEREAAEGGLTEAGRHSPSARIPVSASARLCPRSLACEARHASCVRASLAQQPTSCGLVLSPGGCGGGALDARRGRGLRRPLPP
jgi:hypothetical protein